MKVRERTTKNDETILALKGQKGGKREVDDVERAWSMGGGGEIEREREGERLRENVGGWKNRGEWKQTRRFVSD